MPRAPVLDSSLVGTLGNSLLCDLLETFVLLHSVVFCATVSLCCVSLSSLSLGSHLGFEYPGVWVHVDMAYPVYSVSFRQWCIGISATASCRNITRVCMRIGSARLCVHA